jgi:GNAT superfamily N-acetyltransferase
LATRQVFLKPFSLFQKLILIIICIQSINKIAHLEKEFANAQRDAYQQEFQDPSKLQILSYFRGNISGSLDIIIGQNIAEIDGLYVLEAYRNKGIASAMQQFIMNTFPDKTIIVLADGEDTPREMYIKQKYRYLAFQYEVQKVYMNQKATIKQ